jgi:hypothetical protein
LQPTEDQGRSSMTHDKQTQALVDALKQALTQPGEQRLFRSGKLPGVFAGRAGLNAAAAAQALRDGLLEVTRTETKGKTTTEWVRITPGGVEFVHQHESPLQALRDLRAVLQMTQEGIPVWMGELRKELQVLGDRLMEQTSKIVQQVDVLHQRVVQALQRAEAGGLQASVDVGGMVAWGPQALDYLDKRQVGGTVSHCPLPELFAALRQTQPELTLSDFHAGLRRLHDRGVLQLWPGAESSDLPEPEYALLHGAATYYYAARQTQSSGPGGFLSGPGGGT